MAVEEAVLQTVGKGLSQNTIRFWVNTKAVVIGRFQCPQLETDFAVCREHEVAIARRFTGGGAVYHDLGNLNYSVFLSRMHPLAAGGVVEMFRRTGLAVVSGLEKIGVNAEFKAPNVIRSQGKKISGMAGAVKWNAILVHGTLLVETNLDVLRSVLGPSLGYGASVGNAVRSVPSEVTNVNAPCNKTSMAEVRRVLRIGFESEFGISLRESAMTPAETALANRLKKEKYLCSEWVFRGVSC